MNDETQFLPFNSGKFDHDLKKKCWETSFFTFLSKLTLFNFRRVNFVVWMPFSAIHFSFHITILFTYFWQQCFYNLSKNSLELPNLMIFCRNALNFVIFTAYLRKMERTQKMQDVWNRVWSLENGKMMAFTIHVCKHF